ncbi:uncharacterized protein K444DRAFT_518754, partial [Hyaloscypha bicolor E]
IIHQFPNSTWVESTAVRSSVRLLVTIATAPELYPISPASSKTSTLLHTFAPFIAILGITETQPDRFYVIAGSLSLTPPIDPGLGTYTIYSVDLQNFNSITTTGASIQEVMALTSAVLLNGMGTLSSSSGLIIAADSADGAIYLVDTQTGN